jgi:hypothetical protein
LAELRRKISTTRRLVLARLSDEDFDEGMTALRTYGDMISQDDGVTEEIDWFVFKRDG